MNKLLQQCRTFGSCWFLMSTGFLFDKWYSFLHSFMISWKRHFRNVKQLLISHPVSTFSWICITFSYHSCFTLGGKCQIVLRHRVLSTQNSKTENHLHNQNPTQIEKWRCAINFRILILSDYLIVMSSQFIIIPLLFFQNKFHFFMSLFIAIH